MGQRGFGFAEVVMVEFSMSPVIVNVADFASTELRAAAPSLPEISPANWAAARSKYAPRA